MGRGVESNEGGTKLASEASSDGHLTYLWKEKKSFPTMKGALCAIKWIHKVEGWADPGKSPVIRQLIRAAVLKLYKSMNRKYALNKGQVLNLMRPGGEKENREGR